MNKIFTVYSSKTKQEIKFDDLSSIVTTEDWGKDLIYCDLEGFVLDEYGQLYLLDECGNYAIPPEDRFIVKFLKEE